MHVLFADPERPNVIISDPYVASVLPQAETVGI